MNNIPNENLSPDEIDAITDFIGSKKAGEASLVNIANFSMSGKKIAQVHIEEWTPELEAMRDPDGRMTVPDTDLLIEIYVPTTV